MAGFDPYADITGGGGIPAPAPIQPQAALPSLGNGDPYADIVAGGSGSAPSSLAEKFGHAYDLANEYVGAPKRALDLATGLGADYLKSHGIDTGINPDAGNETGQLLRKINAPLSAMEAYNNAAFDRLPAGLGNTLRGAQEGALDKSTALVTDPVAALVPSSRLIAGAFLPGMVQGAGQQFGQAGADFERGDYAQAAQHGIGGLTDAGFALLGGLHAVHGGPPTLRDKFAGQEQAVAPDLVSESAPPVPLSAPILQRPAFLDEVDRQAPPIAPGPELGYGRGGVPVEAVQPEPLSTPQGQAPPVDIQPGEQTANVAPAPAPAPQPASYADVLLSLPPEQRAAVEGEVYKAKTTDPLTELKNKYGWKELTSDLGPNDHVAVVDLKGFKAINDQYGHDAADEVLTRVGGLLRQHFGDESARQGGDEFGAVLRDHTFEQAQAKVDAFNADLRAMTHTLEGPNGERIDIPAVEAHIGLAGGVDAARSADLAANAHRVQQGSGRRATDVPQPGVQDLSGTVPGTPALPEPRLQDRPQQLTPTFQQWLGDRRVPNDPNYVKSLREDYLQAYPDADREQFRPASGPIAPAIKERPTDYGDLAGSIARADAEARSLVPDEEVEADLRDNVAPTLARGIDKMQRRGGINSMKPELGLENVSGDPKTLVTAIKRDADNPKFLEIREARRLAMADERARFDPSQFEPQGEQPQYAKALPGQRGLPGVAEDVAPPGEKKKAPEQRSMFGGEMLQPSVTRTTEGREAGGGLFTQEQDARARAEAKAQGGIKFAWGENGGTLADLRPRIKEVFKGLPIKELPGGYELPTPSGKRILIKPTGEISFDAKALEKGHGKAAVEKVASGEERLAGATFNLGRDALVHIADHGVLPHESVHVFLDHFASAEERATLQRRFESQAKTEGRAWDEVAADAYNKWFDRPKEVQQSLITRVFERIKDFVSRAAEVFRPTEKGVFRKIESGEVFQRSANEAVPQAAEQKFATAPKAPPQVRPITPEKEAEIQQGERRATGNPPRVEENVQNLRAQEVPRKLGNKEVGGQPGKLGRETPLTQADYTAQRKELKGKTDDYFYNTLKKRTLDPAESQEWDARVQGKALGITEAQQAFDKAQAKGDRHAAATASQDLLAKTLDYVAAQRAYVNDGTAAARALQARAKIQAADITASNPEGFLRKLFREIPGISDQQALDLVHTFKTDPGSLPDLVRAALKPTFRQKFFEAWRAGMLGPTSFIAKAAGDTSAQALSLARTIGGTAIERGAAKIQGRVPEREWAEAYAHIQAIQDGVPTMLHTFLDRLHNESFDVTGRLDTRAVGAIGKAKILGKEYNIGRAVRTPYRVFEGISDAFSQLSGRAEVYRQAMRRAIAEGRQKGLSDTALTDFVEKRASEIKESVLNFDGKYRDIEEAAKKAGEYNTFSGQFAPDGFVDRLGRARKAPGVAGTIAETILPFYNTPLHIAGMAAEHTPLNFARLAYKAYKGELKGGALSEEMVKPIVGTLVGLTFAAAAKQGIVTGSGPADPRQKQNLLDTGWQPYSIKIGDKYVSYHRLEPISSIMGMAADLVESHDEQTKTDLVNKITASVATNFTNKTFLQGLTEATGAISDPVRFAGQFVKGLEGSLVPAAVGRVAQAIDPKLRETSATDLSPILAKIPFASMTLPEKRGATGTPVERPDTGIVGRAYNAISPFAYSEEQKGPIHDLQRVFADIDYVPSTPPRRVAIPNSHGKKVELTDEEYRTLQDADEKVSERLANVVQNPQFKRMDPLEQKAYLRRQYDRAGTQAQRQLYALPAFRARVQQARQSA